MWRDAWVTNALNFRSVAALSSKPIRVLPRGQTVTTDPALSFSANGVQWAVVRIGDEVGVVAEQYLSTTPVAADPVSNPTTNDKAAAGINLDLRHPHGAPQIKALGGFKFARFAYNVSNGVGNTDFDAARALYEPYIDALLRAGITPVVVLTHQTWGEGQGFNWPTMGDDAWRDFAVRWARQILKVAIQYGAWVVYQIWNEGDSASVAAVGVTPLQYAMLLDAACKQILAVALGAKIISQGHVLNQPAYWQQVRKYSNYADRLDGVAIHAYGHGSGKFAPFGPLSPVITRWKTAIRPGQKLWITEWGVLDQPGATEAEVAAYAKGFMAATTGATAACWYAWADGMHNGYGVSGRGALQKAIVG